MTRVTRIAHHRKGHRAELFAAIWLTLKGYRILAMRYKTPVGEIDLIAKRGRTLAFVEVKARHTRAAAATAIHPQNQQRVVQATQYYLAMHPQAQHCTIRFDALLIAWYRFPHHIAGAFDAASGPDSRRYYA